MKFVIALVLICVVVIAVLLWGRKPVVSPEGGASGGAQFLIGTWTGGSSDGEKGGLGSTKTLVFTPTQFMIDGYPALHQEGAYEVVGANDTRISLRLLNQSGDLPTADRVTDIQIVDENTIVFDTETFVRAEE